jgi:dephospho-CoA kinase
MLILGITGGVATGKSTVMRMLADLGALTVSADSLAHTLLAPGTDATRSVLATFPDCAVLNASVPTVDRQALGRLVFADPASRLQLEALTHPPIIAALAEQIGTWRTQPGIAAAAEIPLLFEAKLQWMVDKIVVVTCPKADQIDRLLIRGADEASAHRQLAAQWPLAKKTKQADYLINTDDYADLEATRRQVQALWDTLV